MIVQPGGVQTELFAYSPAGDLISYTDIRGLERQFVYDDAHRLVAIDYQLDPVESVAMTYDAVGNLLTLTERNNDQLVMEYDALNRVERSRRVPAGDLPAWSHANLYDSRGNRRQLLTHVPEPPPALPRYGGGALYGTAQCFDGQVAFDADFNSRSQMVSLRDGQNNTTEFGYDVDGRLVEIDHPNGPPRLKTRHRYDLVGKLLGTTVQQGTDSLWSLSYGYNQAADRLSQLSQWSGGANQTRYELDDSGRLVREVRNRFVVEGAESMAAGELRYTGRGLDHKLRLVRRDDDLNESYLDLQRWELSISEPDQAAVRVKPGGGLHFNSSTGSTLQYGRVLPATYPFDSTHNVYDEFYFPAGPTDWVGEFSGQIYLRHRLPLDGEFDVQVSVSEYHLSTNAHAGLGVTRDPFYTDPLYNKFPTSNGGVVESNGTDIVVTKISAGTLGARFNNHSIASTPEKLRLRRFLDGSNWKIQALYWDGDEWITHANWEDDFSGQRMFAYLHLSRPYYPSGFVGRLRWSDFAETEGTPYLLSSVDGDESVNHANWPAYESQTYDAGFSTDFTRLSWEETLPTNTDVRFQVAVSDDENGPWTYEGPSGANSYYTTPAGQTLTDLTGRYCKFRAFL